MPFPRLAPVRLAAHIELSAVYGNDTPRRIFSWIEASRIACGVRRTCFRLP